MTLDLNRILFNTAVSVFEEGAFALEDMPDDELVIGQSEAIAVEMAFRGEFDGKLSMMLPERLGGMLAANMLGIDEDNPDAQQAKIDASKEILNMIGGHILPLIAGTAPEFKFEAPVAVTAPDFDALAACGFGDFAQAELCIEGSLVKLFFGVSVKLQ